MAHLRRLNPNIRAPRTSKLSELSLSPLTWHQFFESYKDVNIDGDVFRVYISGDSGPVLVLLHGGGYSGLTWALFTKEIKSRIECKVLAVDLRGHGETNTQEDENLSLEYMTRDIISIVNKLCMENEQLIFIGHSMGGALAVHCVQELGNAATLCVIDVVEGTALEALTTMQSFLKNRPSSFPSIEFAIQWCYKSGQTHNLESARISMPGQIKNIKTGKLAASEIITSGTEKTSDSQTRINIPLFKCPPSRIPVINEDETENICETEEQTINNMYTWRINLSNTEKYWRGWFNGLSQEFLNAPVPKLLLLANIHGLDTVLTVGQMQGKFQMQVLPRSGHAIHEDLPDKVADIIAAFLIRHKLTKSVGDYVPVFPAC